MVVALAGNKSDLLDGKKVASEGAQTYAGENGLLFMETSAKTATDVSDLFYEIDCFVCSRHQTHRAWPLWIDHQTGKLVLPVALKIDADFLLRTNILSKIMSLCCFHEILTVTTLSSSFVQRFIQELIVATCFQPSLL